MKETKNITDGQNEDTSFGTGMIILLLVIVLMASIVLNFGQYSIAYSHGYREGYLRGQTDAYIRNWNNLELDSISNVDKKEWILKSKVRYGN